MIREESDSAMSEESLKLHFRCPICLKVLYKPVILHCGHVGCFKCVYKWMMVRKLDCQCFFCNKPFRNLPDVCEKLHNLIRIILPEANKRRERKVQVVREKEGMISRKGGSLTQEIKCPACQLQLKMPISYICGHVFCRGCCNPLVGGRSICSLCLRPHHPGGRPQVCAIFKEFIEENAARKKEDQADGKKKHQTATKKEDDDNVDVAGNIFYNYSEGPQIWTECMCDCCGLYPLDGDIYECMECRESGENYYLCEFCNSHSTETKGKFGQNHLEDHTLHMLPIREEMMPEQEEMIPEQQEMVLDFELIIQLEETEDADSDSDSQ